MGPTSLSLLDRLRRAAPDAPDWGRLQEIYLPLFRSWLCRVPGVHDEAGDLAQEVFVVLVRELPAFRRRRDGSFRAWLRQITLNRVRAFQKARHRRGRTGGAGMDSLLAQLEDPTSDLARQWDEDHDRHVLHRLLALVRPDFRPRTWAAFSRLALDGRPAAQVARELGMSENAVLQAKFRVLKRLRAEAGDLVG
jgi:RNA polymerase sigma-70 factor (ECF subfamily)